MATYSATLIHGFGFDQKHAALLNMPSGAVSIIATIAVSSGVRRGGYRAIWFISVNLIGVVGAALVSFLPKSNRAGLLVGVYLINAVTPILPIGLQWVAANVAGHTKRSFSLAAMAGAYGVGSIIGPQTFQARDAPDYHPAKIAVIGVLSSAIFCQACLFVYYVLTNRSRDRRYGRPELTTDVDASQWQNLTDKQNNSFRYVY